MASNSTAMERDNGTVDFVSSSSLFAVIQHSFWLKTIVTVFVVCAGTRILSSHWFKSVKHSAGHNVSPPTLPYWIPFLRHAFSMGWDSQKFTAKCLSKHGDGTPFFIDAAGHKILVLLDPRQIKRVLNASKSLDPNPFIQEMILGQMLGSPQGAIDFYKADDGKIDHAQIMHFRQHVTGSSLIALSKKVFERLTVNLNEISASNESTEWIDIPDLYEFVQYQTTRAITEALMGTSITKEYPDFYTDLWTFMDRAVEMVSGIPRIFIPTAFNARDKLLANLKTWSAKSEELRLNKKANAQWDPNAGSGLLQERQEIYAQIGALNEDARVSQMLGMLFAGNGITPVVSFWYLFEVLKNAQLLERVSAEIFDHHDPETQQYNFMQLTVRPILQSVHAEATRLYAANVVVRVVTSPNFVLDDKYAIEKGTTLFIYNKITGQFTPGWSEARPHTTSKPLDQFWAERFLVSGDGKRERFSDAGLTGSWTSFGGGEHQCPGRHFARNIGIMTLAAFLGEYECELRDPQTVKGITPSFSDTAFGKMVPTSKIAARIRRRRV